MPLVEPFISQLGRIHHPLVIDWDDTTSPLPRRTIASRGTAATQLPTWMTPPAHLESGNIGEPFDFCRHVSRLCSAIVARSDEFQHVDVSQVLFAVTQARNGRAHGLQARVTPMRFRGGSLTRRHFGREYQVQRFRLNGREMMYVMTFCLPRFLDQDFDEKLITLFHELYHIGRAFDGDLRRHIGRYNVHTHSQKEYDGQMAKLAREYLGQCQEPSLHAFLRLSFAQLRQRHGSVIGFAVPRPKLLPIARLSSQRI